jgi:hypothetical protein
LKALSLSFETGRLYTEREVNRLIEIWLNRVGQSIEVDHVTLRRTLVDEAYLARTADGEAYQLGRVSDVRFFFSEEVTTINTEAVIAEAIREIAKRRELYQKT